MRISDWSSDVCSSDLQVHGVNPSRVAVIPHGIPDRPLTDPEEYKARFGFAGRKVLLTFGLLSPNKGIETVIEALPAVVERHPDVLYVILGATHQLGRASCRERVCPYV